MRAVVQRVTQASVTCAGTDSPSGAIGVGLLVLVAIGRDDTPEDLNYLVDKIIKLRIFPDPDDMVGRFDRSALDIGAEILLVSQFTLYAETRKGRRPSFTGAAAPEIAAATFAAVVECFKQAGLSVQTGIFGAHMTVNLINDGPVTINLDSSDRTRPGR